jgi:type III secretory pathway component EscS
MTDYMQTLLSICFTMITGVIIVASISAGIFLGLFLWNMIQDEF